MESDPKKNLKSPFWRWISAVDHKYSWSFIALVFALIIAGFTIYPTYIRDDRPQLRYDILANTNVLDIKEDVGALKVLFDGIDIREKGLSLSVITVRVLNDSSKDILKSYYDSNAPLGLSISSGQIINYETIASSNEYLNNNLEFKAKNENLLYFSDLIIDSKEYFTIKLLVLHPVDKMPNLEPVGKVAGIRKIQILEPYKGAPKPSFWNLIRNLTIFFIVVVVFFFGSSFIFDKCFFYIANRDKNKIIKEFKSKTKWKNDPQAKKVFDFYRNELSWRIPNGLQRLIDQNKIPNDKNKDFICIPKSAFEHSLYDKEDIELCLKYGLIEKDKNGLIIDCNLLNMMTQFTKYINQQNVTVKKEDIEKKLRIKNVKRKKFIDSLYNDLS